MSLRPFSSLRSQAIGATLSRNPQPSHFLNRCYSSSYSPDPKESHFDRLLKSSFISLSSLKQIHAALTTTSLISDSRHLGAQVIIQYSKFGDPFSSRAVFDNFRHNGCGKIGSFLWNTMIRAYANGGHSLETLELYSMMRRNGIWPDNFTFPFAFKACALRPLIGVGRMAHGDALKIGFGSDSFVQSALVDMYVKCSEFGEGRKVFDEMPVRDLVCWTGMITAYEQGEEPEEALGLFWKMQLEGLLADSITIVSVGSAVGQLGDVKRAKAVHAYAVRKSLVEDLCVVNAILAAYAKCGDMESARSVFGMMEKRNVISWNSMLSGCNQNGLASEALLLFDKMCESGCEPSPVTALIMVTVCAFLGSRYLGKKFHDFVIGSKIKIDTTLLNALMDMYAKCGDLETAVEIFNALEPDERNVSSWNAIISAYGAHGQGKEALELFSRMQEEGVEPNHITLTSVLSACSHAGLIEEGKNCFASMTKLSVRPEVKHYACMVDMLGRAGHLQEAFHLIKEMPLAPNEDVWGALLLACKVHGNFELGKVAANNLFQLVPDYTGYYVLMSNIYATSNKWQEVGKIRLNMKNKGLKKPAAFSKIEYGDKIHGFHTADQESPFWREVSRKVEGLVVEIKMAGHVPDLSCTMHDIEEEDKEHVLNYHSEKLAVAFGILKIEPKMAIVVTKNLRVCNDCHSAFKFISQMYERKIIVRDNNRFHHFEGGTCSCKDYW